VTFKNDGKNEKLELRVSQAGVSTLDGAGGSTPTGVSYSVAQTASPMQLLAWMDGLRSECHRASNGWSVDLPRSCEWASGPNFGNEQLVSGVKIPSFAELRAATR